MIIYKGKEAVCGIQLSIDGVWRYVLSGDDVLRVVIKDSSDNIIEKEYTKADIDTEDKSITVNLSPEETAGFVPGVGTLAAYLNDLTVVRPHVISIRGDE